MGAILETEYHIGGKDKSSYLLHHENSIEIIQMWSMGGNILIKNQIFPIQPQHIYIINGKEAHCTNPLDSDKYIRSKIIISPKYFEMLIRVMGLAESPKIKDLYEHGFLHLAPTVNDSHKIDRIFQLCTQYHREKSEFSTAKMAEQLISLFVYIISAKSDDIPNDVSGNNITAQIVSYLEKNFMEPDFSLERLSKHLHISKYYACHQFKSALGITVGDYVSDLKLTEARKLLIGTDLKVSAIAESLNFSVNSFCRLFKAKHSCTPLEYRKNYKE